MSDRETTSSTASGGDDRDRSDAEEAERAETPARGHRRRPSVADVFGDVLPDTTRDERDRPGETVGDARDDEIRRDVPPHHG